MSILCNWGKVKHGVPQGSILGPLFFLFYTDNLPKVIKINSKPILPADETSLIITNSSPVDVKKDITSAFVQLHEWFNADSLFLHYEKIHYIFFMIKSSSFIDIIIGYNNKLITNTSNTKFLGIIIQNSSPWKTHIDQLVLNSAQLVVQYK
jgi:hypothetical protein